MPPAWERSYRASLHPAIGCGCISASIRRRALPGGRLHLALRRRGRLALIDRRYPERGDAVAALPQHLEAEPVEGECLPRLRDDARFVDDESGDRSRLFVRQM